MWILFLNDMRMSQIEMSEAVARAESKEVLKAFVEGERVEPYRDGQWGKCFRQGGPLEWYNDPWDEDALFRDVGSKEEYMQRCSDNWDREFMCLPSY